MIKKIKKFNVRLKLANPFYVNIRNIKIKVLISQKIIRSIIKTIIKLWNNFIKTFNIIIFKFRLIYLNIQENYN
jgi:hypothetical protein